MNNVPWQEVGFRVRYIRGYLLVPAECFNRGKRYPERTSLTPWDFAGNLHTLCSFTFKPHTAPEALGFYAT
jgi:hypothetical protein